MAGEQRQVFYMQADQLANLLLASRQGSSGHHPSSASQQQSQVIQVIDVREDDFVEGKIPGSHHIPFYKFRQSVEQFITRHVMTLQDGNAGGSPQTTSHLPAADPHASGNHPQPAPTLVLVFHCHFSQTRGPTAAYLVADQLAALEQPGGFIITPSGVARRVQVYILQGGWKAWSKAYRSHADLYEPIPSA